MPAMTIENLAKAIKAQIDLQKFFVTFGENQAEGFCMYKGKLTRFHLENGKLIIGCLISKKMTRDEVWFEIENSPKEIQITAKDITAFYFEDTEKFAHLFANNCLNQISITKSS